MCFVNRDRFGHRGTAFNTLTAILLVILLLPSLTSASTATYYIKEDGASLSAEITLINQSNYPLISMGLNGEGERLKALNFTLIEENGAIVNITKKSSTQITFPEGGNYTLIYDSLIDDYLIHVQYPIPFTTLVFLPVGFDTSNLFLGPMDDGGEIYMIDKNKIRLWDLGIASNTVEYETIIVWTDTHEIQMRFYPASYKRSFMVCVGLWFSFFFAVGCWCWRLKRRVNQYL